MTPAWVKLARTVPRAHQIEGVQFLCTHPFALLADEVGAGKTKQVVDTACVLQQAGLIDGVVTTVPNFARGVWGNPDPAIGEIAKHGWESLGQVVREYSVRFPALRPWQDGSLNWLVTNYEFFRRPERLKPLLAFLKGKRFLLACDEAWALADHRTDQWKATHKIRQLAARVIELNGTPVGDNPLDLYAQMLLLDPSILGIKYWTAFRARYALLKPNVNYPQVIGWQNLEELRAKVEPHVIRRLTRDCFDLPEILEPVTIEAPLTAENWARYKAMRDEMIVWLETADKVSIASQAIVKSTRLRQMTSGILGGLQAAGGSDPTTEFIGTEKQDSVLSWLHHNGRPERLLLWSVFRPEAERLAERFGTMCETHLMYGGNSPAEREACERALSPFVDRTEPVVVVALQQAGAASMNFAGASLAITVSQHPSLRVYAQARGRIDRPGQRNGIRYVDVVATGPQGQRTIDHHTTAALRNKEDIAQWTAATWRRKLTEE